MKTIFTRFERIYHQASPVLPEVRKNSLWVAPGLFFILLGLCTLLAPKLVLGLVAGFCLFVGALLCVAGWKLVQLKNRVEKMARQFDGRIFIQGVQVRPEPTEDSPPDQKKIVYH
jgi:uncharacterized membrane protein